VMLNHKICSIAKQIIIKEQVIDVVFNFRSTQKVIE